MKITVRNSLPLLAALVAACSHTSYKPEVSGPKATVSRGGVVFPIPPVGPPHVKMKLVSEATPKDHTLHVRMYFKRLTTDPSQIASLDPRAQILILPDNGAELRPSKIYANTTAKPSVNLKSADRQAVELVYDLPKGGDEYPYFKIRWAIKYGKQKIEAQTTRFDRDETSSGNPDPFSPEFPKADAYDAQYEPAWFGPEGWDWW